MSVASHMGYGAAGVAGASGAAMQRRLRKMSAYPLQPRVFSQAKILVPVGLLGSVMAVPTWVFLTVEHFNGKGQGWAQVFGPAFPMVISLMLFTHGLWRRFGVDDDRVWTRFGKVFYREVRFSEITRLEVGYQRFRVHSADTVVNIDYNRFDYALVYYGLLRELQKRRFELAHKVMPDDAGWEEEAASWRRLLAKRIVWEHLEFFDRHREELDYLTALTKAPAVYDGVDRVSVDVMRPLVFKEDYVPVEGSRVFARKWFRRSKVDLFQPRKFSYFWQVVPLSLLGFLLFSLKAYGDLNFYFSGLEKWFVSSIISLSAALVFGVFLFYGLLRRFGVDEQRVWSGFGFLRREVKFSEVTGVCLEGKYVKVSAGRRVLRVNFERFDYALALFGLLRELGERRFIVDGVVPGEPGWERRAQIWRNMLGAMIFEDHSGYLLEHPAKLAYLNQLMQPPVTYED